MISSLFSESNKVHLSASASSIAKSSTQVLSKAFGGDEKIAKQVLSAAKRVLKKRSLETDPTNPSPSPAKKKQKPSFPTPEDPTTQTPAALETSLALPTPIKDPAQLENIVLETNRAPLLLAFVVTLLKYNMPAQPLSSRLSLGQAVVSANSRSKAVSIGLEEGKSAEEEGWGGEWPVVVVMGREVRVLRRWGYDPDEGKEELPKEEERNDVEDGAPKGENEETQKSATTLIGDTQSSLQTLNHEEIQQSTAAAAAPEEPPLWGIDLEALKGKNPSSAKSSHHTTTSPNLPIHTPHSARSYLLKSFTRAPIPTPGHEKEKKTPASVLAAEKEENLALLLGALELVFESWVEGGRVERGKLGWRAWEGYCRVRPDVRGGVGGWGERGRVGLGEKGVLGLGWRE
ncbi:hypothetical protein K402DRAFT_63253 [Aulographum hederae CBS 113979]|uniref:Uncharacterized protein n=1 Tax=Aulographum hederae CBS 113979 TaxID=1176131 RepID=A0A6G1H1K2_9PEZI|nr:hypothetical protein K402DRAFT_63253 [Aulographum hederae CBS 113979]